MRRRALLGVGLALALATAAPAVAAPDTVVDFEGIPANTLISEQYAGVGVLFGHAVSFGLPAPEYSCRPYGSANGIAGTSATIACGTGPAEFPTRFFGTAMEFGTERRAVSFRLSSRVAFQGAPLTADVRAYGIGGTLKEHKNVSLPAGANVTVSFSRPTSDIAAIVISGSLEPQNSGPVLLDDIVATLDDVPPPPKFTLALATPSIEVVEGATGEATVSVRRFNGSTGPVTLGVGALPTGISATQFDPNPTTGRNDVAMRITAARPFVGQRQLTVSATGGGPAGTGVVTDLVQTVTGIPAVYFATGGRTAVRLVPGCGPQTVDDSFNVRGGFTGTVTVSIPNATGGLTAAVPAPFVSVGGDGVHPFGLALDPGAGSGGEFTVRARPTTGTPAELVVPWIADRVSVFRVSPSPVALPVVTGRTTVTVLGNFPSRCPVTFADGTGLQWPVRSRDSTEIDGRYYDRVTLDIPARGVAGPLRVLSPTGAELARTERIDLTEYRNTFALSQANAGPGARANDYTWADFERTFGTDDTDACFVFCVRDPIAADYYDQFRAAVQSGGGLCLGWATMSMRFRGFNGISQRPSEYQAGATRAFQIQPLTDGTAVKRDVVRWQVAQNDKNYAAARTAALARSAADERTLARELIGRHGAAMISIRQGGSGHAVVANGIQDTAAGGVQLSIYDPNTPYTSGEETSQAVRNAAMTQSTITIDAAGNWSGSSLNWSGGNGTLGVVSMLPPTDADLPSTFSLASLIGADTAAAGSGAPGVVTDISSGGRSLLGPGGEPGTGTGVTLQPVESGAGALPEYVLAPGRGYELTVRGTRRGRYAHGLIGRGANARVTGAATSPGQEDRLTLRPGEAQLEFRTGATSAPVTYELAEEAGKGTRTATVAMTARRGGTDAAELGGGTLRLEHDGPPTTATVTLGSVGTALPSAATTAPLRVGRGERIEVRPRAWTDLGRGARMTVRNAKGRVLRRTNVRMRTTTKVALAGVAARRKGTRVTVTGRVAKRGSAPVLAAVVEVVRRGRVVRRRTVTRRGGAVRAARFSLPVTIGKVPRGASVRARVVLLDEAAGLASVRRTVRARG
jgi:hypothetical protein